MIKESFKYRDYTQPIIWKGDLNDDCTAKWAGLLLRAEWMDDDYWWWSVYDMYDNEKQIDSSNEYNKPYTNGEIARKTAEDKAKEFLKNELILKIKKTNAQLNIELLISELKTIGISPTQLISTLVKDFNFDLKIAKESVLNL